MESGHNLPNEKTAQAIALATALAYSQRHIKRVLSCSRCAVQKNNIEY